MFARLTNLHSNVTLKKKKSVEWYYFHIVIYIIFTISPFLCVTQYIGNQVLIRIYLKENCVCEPAYRYKK